MKRALDPAGFPQAASTPDWDVAAVKVTAGPGNVDYSSTQLMPVLLILRNKSAKQPQVILEDVRAVGKNAEYLVYGAEEAMRLAASPSFSRKAGNTAKSAAVGTGVGAALGAGAGAVLYVLTGKKNPEYLWLGAAGGGAVGGMAGAAMSDSSFSKAEQEAMRADLAANVWQEDPITPGTTRTGYLLVPAGLGVSSLRIVIRTDAAMETRTLAIASDKDYNAAAPAMAAPAAAPTAAQAKPARSPDAAPPTPASPAGGEGPEPAREDGPESYEI